MFNIDDSELGRLNEELRRDGFSFLTSRCSIQECDAVKEFMDAYPDERSEINFSGTEKRIWDAQTYNDTIRNFSEKADQLLSALLKKKAISYTTLAIRNFPVSKDPTDNLGRWHLDSFRNQFKVFAFLTGTTESSGPLELIPGSHTVGFKIVPILTGKYFSFRDIRHSKRRYSSLDEDWLDRVIQEKGGSRPILCEPGSVLVTNTSAIHRARPCLEGNRYALTGYYKHI